MEIELKNHTPVESGDLDVALQMFLFSIGYLPKGYVPKKQSETKIQDSLPLRLFKLFIMWPHRRFTINELREYLEYRGEKPSRPSLYRHLNKLIDLGLIKKEKLGKESKFVLCESNVYMAWKQHTLPTIQRILENLTKTVKYISRKSET